MLLQQLQQNKIIYSKVFCWLIVVALVVNEQHILELA